MDDIIVCGLTIEQIKALKRYYEEREGRPAKEIDDIGLSSSELERWRHVQAEQRERESVGTTSSAKPI